MKRRSFIKKVGLGAAAAGAVLSAPAVHAQKRFRWRVVTTWSPALDVLQGGPLRFAKLCEAMSGGRLEIQVFAAGELAPAFGTFDAVSQGTVEMGHAAAYYWAGKTPACQWFASVPFGLNAWLYQGGGLELWEEIYAPFDLVPRPGGNTGVQWAGWFNKKIQTIEDFRGLKMRIPGLGGKVISKAGGTVVLLPGGEIFTALERGVIDAAEWVGPWDDVKLGIHTAAKYNYYPGWHEPGTTTEFLFHRKAYEALPSDLKAVVDAAAADVNAWMLAEYNFKNAKNLQLLKTEYKDRVEVLPLPSDVLRALRPLAIEAREEEAAKDSAARKVHEAFNKFQALADPMYLVSEGAYLQAISG